MLRQFGVVAAGCFGAEVVGAAGFAVTAGLIATNWLPTTLAGVLLLPVLTAAAGPVGYDMATSWVPDDEKGPSPEPGMRAAAHAAGVAGALVVLLGCLGLAAGLATDSSVYLFFATLFALPCLAVAGRPVAVRAFSGSRALLPVSLVVIVGAAPALLFVFGVLIGRLVGDD